MEEIRKAGQGKCEDADREGTETPPRSVSWARTQYFAMGCERWRQFRRHRRERPTCKRRSGPAANGPDVVRDPLPNAIRAPPGVFSNRGRSVRYACAGGRGRQLRRWAMVSPSRREEGTTVPENGDHGR